ncbi:MAG: DUF3459 domain-containing protein, partial [Gemmiger sp.]
FEPEYDETDTVMAFYRYDGEKRVLVAANFGRAAVELELRYPVKDIILSNMGRIYVGESLMLNSLEVIVLECLNK